MVEVEIRFKAENLSEDLLRSIGAKLISESKEVDKYFKFSKDKERSFILRIREKNNEFLLTLKGSSKLKTDCAWPEWETKINNHKELENFLINNNFEELVMINKLRKKFKYQNFEINLDNIEGLGKFVEVELIGEDSEKLRRDIITFVKNKLGIKEDNIIEKGYVKLMLKEE